MRILFITPELPYPLIKGYQVRGYHQLRLLSKRHRITLLSLVKGRVDQDNLDKLLPFVDEIVTIPVNQVRQSFNVLSGVFSRLPLQTALYWNPRLAKLVNKYVNSGKYDIAYIQLARMAPHLINESRIPKVIDLVDSLSLNMQRRYQSDHRLLRPLIYKEWKRMALYEQEICKAFDMATVVSNNDRETIGDYKNLKVNPLGVNLTDYAYIEPTIRKNTDTIVFTGNMSYFPNVNAADWFVRNVWAMIKIKIPTANLYIVGANPTQPIVRLAEKDQSITVTGYVKNVHDYLSKAAISVAPLQSGSGMQFKILEAMACGTPIVATSFALGGISALHERHLLVANTAVEFAQSAVRLLKDMKLRQSLAETSRKMVEDVFSWEKCTEDFETALESVVSSHHAD